MIVPSRKEIATAIGILFEQGDVIELRSLGVEASGRSTVNSGYFDNVEALAAAAAGVSGARGVYVVLNPVEPALLARAANRVRCVGKEPTTTDADVARRRWLLVDVDPVRPSGISASDEEHELAFAKAQVIQEALTDLSWPAPVFVDSGNGAYLLYRIQLPNDPESTNLLRCVLDALAFRFDDAKVTVDTAVYNAARLAKVPGTAARKGDDLPQRPHRLAKLLSVPDTLSVVQPALLVALASTLPTPFSTGSESDRKMFDIETWIAAYGLSVLGPRPWQAGKKWIFPTCPWNGDHGNRSAYLIQFATGAVQAGCLHTSCRDKDWKSLRDLYEPGWRQHHAWGSETDSAQYRKGVRAERKLLFETAAEIAGRSPHGFPGLLALGSLQAA